jgi:succinate dehydrogenase / fumarate reductase membrane anchor subunit
MLNATKKWLSLKLSSVIMVPFMIWFLVNFVSIYDSNYENIVEFFSSSQSALIFSIFIIITFFHSALSISEYLKIILVAKKQENLLI